MVGRIIFHLPLKLTDHHMQALLYWNVIYKHIFTPHNAIIWSIRVIHYDKIWMEERLWAILHLGRKITIFFCNTNIWYSNYWQLQLNVLLGNSMRWSSTVIMLCYLKMLNKAGGKNANSLIYCVDSGVSLLCKLCTLIKWLNLKLRG